MRWVGYACAVVALFLVVGVDPGLWAIGDALELRLGSPGEYVRHAGVTFRTVAAPESEPGSITFELRTVPRSTLYVAVSPKASDESPQPAGTVSCAVRLWRLSRPWAQPLATFDLDLATVGWKQLPVEFPGSWVGRLSVGCTGPAPTAPAVEWAQPVLVPVRRPASPPPLVVLISLDTMRADHVEGFGGAEGSTPALRRLGMEGIRFVNATAESTWTLHSHFAMLFSTLLGLPVRDAPLRSLADALADRGFVTTAFTGGGFMSRDFQFHRGFDRFVEYDGRRYLGAEVKMLPEILRDATDLIDRHASLPLFLFLHTYAVHQPTQVEVDWTRTHGDFTLFHPTAAQIDDARRFYENLVRETDRELAGFFEFLRELNRRRPVLLVVTSDHGEAFGEHANFRHGWGPSIGLYEELSRIPFIVWGPGRVASGKVLDRPVMLADVAPSLLASQGAAVPVSMRGDDLWGLWTDAAGERGSPREPAASLSYTQQLWAMRNAKEKLIVGLPPGAPQSVELYDLVADPGEKRNLAAAAPERVAALKAELRSLLAHFGLSADGSPEGLPACPLCEWDQLAAFWDQAFPSETLAGSDDIHPDTAERLRALGYLN